MFPHKYRQQRTSAYECQVDTLGNPIKAVRYVTGWYGPCFEHRLEHEVMPKLAEYVDRGWSYPFLITQHLLDALTKANIDPSKGVKFSPRKKRSQRSWYALVLSHGVQTAIAEIGNSSLNTVLSFFNYSIRDKVKPNKTCRRNGTK